LLPEINVLIVLLMTDQAVSQRAEVSAKGPDLWRTRKFGSIERYTSRKRAYSTKPEKTPK
jgi:hypothetical protein